MKMLLFIMLLMAALPAMSQYTGYYKQTGKVVDAETGFEQYIDTGSKSLRKAYSRYWNDRQKELKNTFTRSNVDNVSIATNEDYVKQLLGLFKQRS